MDNNLFFFTGYKYGTCPYVADYGAVGGFCRSDYDCPGAQKCCSAAPHGFYRCQVPVEFSRPGRCSNSQGSVGGSYCSVDTQCYHGQKCCTGYGGDVNTCKYVYGVVIPYSSAPFAGGANFGVGSAGPLLNPGVNAINTFPAVGSFGIGVLPGGVNGGRSRKVYWT
jgi:hypothetical protein